MFLSRNKKNNVYPSKPQFYYIKVGFKGVKIIYVCFHDESANYHINLKLYNFNSSFLYTFHAVRLVEGECLLLQ